MKKVSIFPYTIVFMLCKMMVLAEEYMAQDIVAKMQEMIDQAIHLMKKINNIFSPWFKIVTSHFWN